jgi:PAS domain S-box-containing protein
MASHPQRAEPTDEDRREAKFPDMRSPELARSWLSAIIESADDAVITKTLDGIITSWNRGAERIFGYSADEAVGKSVTILIPEDHINEEPSILARLKAGERVEHYETVRRRKDGSLVDISLTVSPIKADDGKVIGASKVARDISPRKESEKALKDQTDVIETVNRLVGTLAGELDLDKLAQAVNDAAREISGARFSCFFYEGNAPDESLVRCALSGLPSETCANFPQPRDLTNFRPKFKDPRHVLIDDIRSDPRYGDDSPYYGIPQDQLPLTSYLAVPVISRSGKIYGGLFFGHPRKGAFTERGARTVEGVAGGAAIAMDNARLYESAQRARAEAERAAKENERLYRQAEESSQLKEEFLATVSHELRNPLNSILGWSRMLRAGQIAQDGVPKALETIERNARAQAQLIDDLLDVSRIMSGKLRMDVRPADPNLFIEGAIEAVKPAAAAKGVRLQKVVDTGIAAVPGDPVRLQQVVWNLLSNAIKFTPRGGQVQVLLERVDSHVEIVVNDTGEGIPAEFLPHVFDRFRQADQRSARQHGGLGLGLAIVKHVVELHGGSVTAASPGVGKGATFTVRIPVVPIYQMDPAGGRVHPSARDLLPPTDCADRLDSLTILVVDDEADTRELLKTGLESCGAQVTLAASAAEALEALESSVPDVLISDIGMPGEDGYDLLRHLRSLPPERGGRVPAIALTAYARVEDRLKALRSGYQMHVPKPVDLAELVAVADSLVNRTSGQLQDY